MDTWALSLLSSSFKRSMCSIFSFNSSEQLESLALYEGHLGQSLACADVILLVSCVTGLDGSVPFSAAGTFNYATQLSYVSILSPHALNLREKKERREKRERLFNGSTPSATSLSTSFFSVPPYLSSRNLFKGYQQST